MANRNFAFTWYENPKYGEPITRKNAITVPNASPDTGLAAKAAVNVFTKAFGSVKKNTIVSIQEYNDGGPVGEPIVPSEDNDIIPTKK